VNRVNRISLNVVVFNEEGRLEECLVDARDHVDEIVVVDQMSTDGTPAIAQRLADVYVRDVHHGHAEPSRELAATRSSGDWLLILDADEKLSDLFKCELRRLVERDVDGYWIQKVNLVDGRERDKIHHFRLVRKSRVRFDPQPHGGATAVTENVERFDRIGIVHEKSLAEQIFDDARYERLALEDGAPTSAKRNWLSHNRVLVADRRQSRRRDLEALVPPGAARVLVLGEVTVELPRCAVTRISGSDLDRIARGGRARTSVEGTFDAALLAASDDDLLRSVRILAGLLRPGGVIVGTAPAARNRQKIEEFLGTVLSQGSGPNWQSTGGVTRRQLLDELPAAGLDVRWMRVRRDGWLDPLALRPDGGGTVVESEQFLLRSVPAEVAEELTADQIVFAAARRSQTEVPSCSVVLAALAGANPEPFAHALRATTPHDSYELVLVHSNPNARPIAGATTVLVEEEASLAMRWNAGARAASAELLVFASADSAPLRGWLDALVQAHRSRPDTGAVGSKVIAEDGTVEHSGLVLGSDRIPYRLYQGAAATAPHVNRPRIMPAVAADGMVTARARFVEVGGFDETLGQDLTDADLCLRLRARGLPIIYCPAAVLRSQPRSASGMRGLWRTSAREFVARWGPTTPRSDELVCLADGRDVNAESKLSWRLPRPSGAGSGTWPAILWTGHFHEHGGYTEEALAAVEALDDAGLHVVANPLWWDRRDAPLPAKKAKRLAELLERDLPADFVHVLHIGAHHFKRHPAALRNIGRTMFETDGIPVDWRDQCNAMDEVWVPSEHNLRTFANAGVAVSKLHKVPETFDAELFDPAVAPLPLDGVEGFVFLSMFSWIGRKAWDLLLRAFFEEFDGHDDVTLLLKTDAALAPPGTDCRREVEAYIRNQLQHDPLRGPRVVVLDRPLEVAEVPRLYRAADAFVLASHGEGWGRPYMEAMAMGLPTIATAWSGNLEFMNEDNSYLVDFTLVPAPTDGWLRGQRWAEPSVSDLRRAMRSVYENRLEAHETGQRARADVLVSCRPELVAEAVRERIQAIVRRRAGTSRVHRAPHHEPVAPSMRVHPTEDRPRISACVVQHGETPALSQCLSSLHPLTDAITVMEAGSGEDMATVRNGALDRAAGDWVLMLDSTHTLDPASVDLVRELAEQDRFVGYAARELHQFGLDGAVSAVERRTAVLFPRHPDLRYAGRVDEQLLPQRPDLKFRLARSRIVVHQHDHRADRHEPVARARRHLPLLERSVREEPHEPFHLHNLGVALQLLRLSSEAETTLRRAIALASPDALWGPSAYAALSRAVADQGRLDDAVTLSKTATRLAPDWPHGWCMLGATLVDAGRLEAALRAYARALNCGGETWSPADVPDDTAWQIRAGMGRIHLLCRQYDQAAECLAGAVAINPVNAELHVLLARAYDALRRPKDARHHLDRATMVTRGGPTGFAALGDLFAKKAEDALLRGLVENPESTVLREQIERLRAARAGT
jgi:glycosyltransferase involved in cell wall biosynthesis/tetratricopeptide (TPR) repeat protein